MSELDELKLEYDRKSRTKESLEKNYERRKKLNLLTDSYQKEISAELRQLNSDLSYLQRKIRSIESEENRRRMINK